MEIALVTLSLYSIASWSNQGEAYCRQRSDRKLPHIVINLFTPPEHRSDLHQSPCWVLSPFSLALGSAGHSLQVFQ